MPLRFVGFALFLVFLLSAIVALWPASALAPWIESVSKGHWHLAAAEGSFWNGNGILLAHDGAGRSIAQNIRWQLRWSELVHGRIGVNTAFEQGGGLIVAEPDGITVEQLDAQLPAAMLVILLPGAIGRYGWAGTLHARSNNFHCSWHGDLCAGEIELEWDDAAVAEVTGNRLGDYRVRVVGEGRALRFDLSTLRGRLQINGSGEITRSGLRFNGEAGASGADAASLDALLRTLGRVAATPGRYLIDYRETSTNG